MNTIPVSMPLADACKKIKYQARQQIVDNSDIPANCIWLLQRYPATLILTRETGYHSSGWWKNPQYERCWHLSMSFKSGSESKATMEMLKLIFGEHISMIWTEAPFSEGGKSLNVWHYRLFCDENWLPVKPQGEVYSTQFTERNWKSFSEVNAY